MLPYRSLPLMPGYCAWATSGTASVDVQVIYYLWKQYLATVRASAPAAVADSIGDAI